MAEVIQFPEIKAPIPHVNKSLEHALSEVEAIITPFANSNENNETCSYFGEFTSDSITAMMIDNISRSIERIKDRPLMDIVQKKNFNELCNINKRLRNLIIYATSTIVKGAKNEIQA